MVQETRLSPDIQRILHNGYFGETVVVAAGAFRLQAAGEVESENGESQEDSRDRDNGQDFFDFGCFGVHRVLSSRFFSENTGFVLESCP